MNQENPLNPDSDTAEPIDLHVSIVNPERTFKSSFSQRKHTYHKLCGKLINKLHRYETPRLPLLGSPEVRGGSRRYVIEINMSQEIPPGVVPQTFLNILHFAAVRRCTLYFHSRKTYPPLVYSLIPCMYRVQIYRLVGAGGVNQLINPNKFSIRTSSHFPKGFRPMFHVSEEP